MLELRALKGARAVLRGGGAGNSTSLPDLLTSHANRVSSWFSASARVSRQQSVALARLSLGISVVFLCHKIKLFKEMGTVNLNKGAERGRNSFC